jgi:hypothetical protein
VLALEIRPELGRRAERAGQEPRCGGRHATPASNDLVDALQWDPQVSCERNLRDPEGNEEFLAQDFAGVSGSSVFREHGRVQ